MNERQKKFVSGVISGLSPTKAAEEAGYAEGESSARVANRLMKDPEISKVIEDGKAKVVANESLPYDLDKAMKQADHAYQEAVKAKSLTAMLNAVELQSKLQGIWNDRNPKNTQGNFILSLPNVPPPEYGNGEKYLKILDLASSIGLNVDDVIELLENFIKEKKGSENGSK